MRSATLLPLILLAACYSYHPLESPAPESGIRVEAELTGGGSLAMASQIGPGAMTVRGEVLQTDAEAMILALSSVLGRNEQETYWKGEQVRFPLITVERVQERKFALVKTLMFTGALVGSLFVAVKAFDVGDSGEGTSGGGGGAGPQ
ncbi:MAG TPA: hypothetical protein VE282_05955 [Gemmatimonadales bacterium]|jgi:hypothetical protein|nr:hypothetical protein [Gemmatimonadales bacterium]